MRPVRRGIGIGQHFPFRPLDIRISNAGVGPATLEGLNDFPNLLWRMFADARQGTGFFESPDRYRDLGF